MGEVSWREASRAHSRWFTDTRPAGPGRCLGPGGGEAGGKHRVPAAGRHHPEWFTWGDFCLQLLRGSSTASSLPAADRLPLGEEEDGQGILQDQHLTAAMVNRMSPAFPG